jgi:Fe-Mn family superoxide dismutase
MKFVLPPLPFALDALEPHLSRDQLYYHYEKHHRGYLEKLDSELKNSEKRTLPLEEIIRTSKGKTFNFAAQLWNHSFLWHCLTPHRQALQDGRLADLMQSSFGGVDGFNDRFAKAAEEEFGSGWAWLVYDPQLRRLSIMSTDDAKNPLQTDLVPLLTLDVWEHAYYLDYKHDRKSYISVFLEHLINWQFAEEGLSRHLEQRQKRRSG